MSPLGSMSGGFYSKAGGVPLGVRAGFPEPAGARPWERVPGGLVQPRERHVDVFVAGRWERGLAVALRHEPSGWRVLVAYVLSPGGVREEWVDEAAVRPRS